MFLCSVQVKEVAQTNSCILDPLVSADCGAQSWPVRLTRRVPADRSCLARAAFELRAREGFAALASYLWGLGWFVLSAPTPAKPVQPDRHVTCIYTAAE